MQIERVRDRDHRPPFVGLAPPYRIEVDNSALEVNVTTQDVLLPLKREDRFRAVTGIQTQQYEGGQVQARFWLPLSSPEDRCCFLPSEPSIPSRALFGQPHRRSLSQIALNATIFERRVERTQ